MVSIIRNVARTGEYQMAAATLGLTVTIGLIFRSTFSQHLALASILVPIGYFAGKGIDHLFSNVENPEAAPSEKKNVPVKGGRPKTTTAREAAVVSKKEMSPKRATKTTTKTTPEVTIEEPSFLGSSLSLLARVVTNWQPQFTQKRVIMGAGALTALTVASIPCIKYGLGRTIGTVGFVVGGIFLGIEGSKRSFHFLKSLVKQRSVQYVGAGAGVAGGVVAMTTNSLKWGLLASMAATVGGFVLRYKLSAGNKPIIPEASSARASVIPSSSRPATPTTTSTSRPSSPAPSSPTTTTTILHLPTAPAPTRVEDELQPQGSQGPILLPSSGAVVSASFATPQKPKGSSKEASPLQIPSTLRRRSSFSSLPLTGSVTGSVATPPPPPPSSSSFVVPHQSPGQAARGLLLGAAPSSLLTGGLINPAMAVPSSSSSSSSAHHSSPLLPTDFAEVHPSQRPVTRRELPPEGSLEATRGFWSRISGPSVPTSPAASGNSGNPFVVTRSLPRTPKSSTASSANPSASSSSGPIVTTTGTPITPSGAPNPAGSPMGTLYAPAAPRSSILGFLTRTPPPPKKPG